MYAPGLNHTVKSAKKVYIIYTVWVVASQKVLEKKCCLLPPSQNEKSEEYRESEMICP